MILFQTMPFWNVFHVPYDKLKTRFEYFLEKKNE